MTPFWQRLAGGLRQGRPVFVALVVDHTRHSPGTAGARLTAMLRGDDMVAQGTIGGGIMEHRLLQQAETILRRGDAFSQHLDLHHVAEAPKGRQTSGMVCAGRQTNLYYLCRPETEGPVVEQIVDALEANAQRDAAGQDGPVPTLEVRPDGWRLSLESVDWQRPAHQLEALDGSFVYREELLNRRRLVLFGGGHCALAVARLTHRLGYHVMVVEGPKKAPEEDLDQHVEWIHQVEDFVEGASGVRYPEITQAIVLTSDLESDVRALQGALRRPFPFLGVMGSPAKIHRIRQRLLESGFSEDDLARLVAPVGLPMASRTPDEIAVSVAAQLLQVA